MHEISSTFGGFGGPPAAPGVVHLVGGGPGDPGLVTLRAATLLSTCDVVAYDRLAPEEALALVPDGAERICVGKRAGETGMSRATVDELLRDRALAGRAVVRLKGGDPFVFGRGGEEAQACAAAGVPVEVVPGITSSVAVPAAAGIPVTHRTVAAGFAVATGHEDPAKPAGRIDHAALATYPGTLVLLMGLERLAELARRLVAEGSDPRTPAAVVQWGTTARQRTVEGTLATIADRVAEAGIGSPAVVVVGDVVRLRHGIVHREQRPLHGARILLPRIADQPSRIAAHLRAAGADVCELPVARTLPADPAGLDAAARTLADGGLDAVTVPSPAAFERLQAALVRTGHDLRTLAGIRIIALGARTAGALAERGVVCDDVRASPAALCDAPARAGRVLVLTAGDDRGVCDALARAGSVPTAVTAVVTERVPVDSDLRDRLAATTDVVLVPASAAAAPLAATGLTASLPVVSIGPTTTAALVAAGVAVAGEAVTPDPSAVGAEVGRALGRPRESEEGASLRDQLHGLVYAPGRSTHPLTPGTRR